MILGLHALAILSSAIHSVGDGMLIGATMSLAAGIVYLLLAAAAFTWWIYSLSRMARSGLRAGAWGAAAMALLWGAVANGATVLACPPPCGAGAWADAVHIGSLVFGLAAAASTVAVAVRSARG